MSRQHPSQPKATSPSLPGPPATSTLNREEPLKELTRGRRITGEDLRAFVAGLGLPDDVATRLAAMTPASYTGAAEDLVRFLNG